MQLTDTQRITLSAAAQREDGAILPLPTSLKARGAAVTNLVNSLHKKGLVAEQPASPDAAAWREAQNGGRMMLVITDAGLRAIDGGLAAESRKQPARTTARTKQPRRRARRASVGSTPKHPRSAPVRRGTKQGTLIDLLKRKRGATIEEMVEATGWQAHSVRGAISGALKKTLGLPVTSEKVNGRSRVYRIVARG